MVRVLEAIYEGGVLKPLDDPGLVEHQRVVVEIRSAEETDTDSPLGAWQQVYTGLSETEIVEVEAIALDWSCPDFVDTIPLP